MMCVFLGCRGNANNFESKTQCQETCRRHIRRPSYNQVESDLCQLPAERGPCRAMKPRFFFNSERQKCERFMYGGCKGNANNFESFIECVETCNNPSVQSNKKAKMNLKVSGRLSNLFETHHFHLPYLFFIGIWTRPI